LVADSLDTKHADHVSVANPRQGAALAQDSAAKIGIANMSMQDLDGELALEIRIPCAMHAAEGAGADFLAEVESAPRSFAGSRLAAGVRSLPCWLDARSVLTPVIGPVRAGQGVHDAQAFELGPFILRGRGQRKGRPVYGGAIGHERCDVVECLSRLHGTLPECCLPDSACGPFYRSPDRSRRGRP